MTKRFFPGELEGNGFSKLAQVMQQAGYNKDVALDIGKVVAAPPNLRIKLQSDGLTLEKSDMIIAQHLTKYTMIINDVESTINNELKLGEKVIVISDDDTEQFYVLDRAVAY